MLKKLFFVLIIAITSVHVSVCQQHYTRNYSINNGLPDNCIRDLFKDSRGFLWIATDAGLSSFDGKNFNIYTSQEGLAGDKINSITEDEKGNIWIGCNKGISKLNGKNIISYNMSSGIVSNEVSNIHYSKENKILIIGTNDGLSVFDGEDFISFHKKLGNVKERIQVVNFLETKKAIYVFTNTSGNYKYIPDTKKLESLTAKDKFNKTTIHSVFISSSGDTLIGFNDERSVLRGKEKKMVHESGLWTDFIEDNENDIWIASSVYSYGNRGGILKYENNELSDYSEYLQIKSNDILALEYDQVENLLWIGTKEHGLYLYPLSNFSYFKPKDFDLKELNIVGLETDSHNNLWMANKNNVIKKSIQDFKIFSFDLFLSEFKKFQKTKLKVKYGFLKDESGSYEKYEQKISNNTYPFANPYRKINGDKLPPKSLYKPLKYEILINKKLKELNGLWIDSEDHIWVGSNVGIFKIDKNSENPVFFDMEGTEFTSFAIGENNRVYGVSWADLFIYPNIEKIPRYESFNYYEQKSPINIRKIKIQKERVWFISSDHGLFLYDKDKFYSSNFDESFDCGCFNDICVDNQGNVIVGGNNGKIYIAEFLNNSIRLKYVIDKESELKGTSIRFLTCTKDNILIAGTNAGLNLVNLNNLYNSGIISITTIDEFKGFIDYSGNTSKIQDSKFLWIGSNSNLICTDLDKIISSKFKNTNFYIKSLEINNEEFDLGTVTNTEIWTNIPKSNFKLPYYKNSISIKYDAIKFLDHENINFSYKLEGYHKKWINENKDRNIVLHNLKSGKYRLRIKVLNENENITKQELLLSFEIGKPFWLKWWFISSIVISILGFIWLMIYLRGQSIKKFERQRTEISERISEFEMKALRAQMNPHFIFNVINSIQNYMLDNNVDEALNYLSDFAKLIRLTLDNVSKKLISLDEELKYLKYYLNLEQMRFGKRFEIDIKMPSEFESRRFLIPSMILQPYVENSIKHGFPFKEEGGKINLEFSVSDHNILKCTIEDNGIGRVKSRELNKSNVNRSSKGTYITNERLALLNQTQKRKGFKVEIIDLYDDQDNASGTKVEIFIPI